jgi:hypothetical protein
MSEHAAGVIVAYLYPIVDAAMAEFLRQQYGALTRRWEQISSGSSHHYISSGKTRVFEVAVRSIARGSTADNETLIVVSFKTYHGGTTSDILLQAFLRWWELDREGMEPFRQMLTADTMPEIRLVKPAIVPIQAPKGSTSASEWLDYRAAMLQQGIRITLHELSSQSGIPESTIKKASAARARSNEP